MQVGKDIQNQPGNKQQNNDQNSHKETIQYTVTRKIWAEVSGKDYFPTLAEVLLNVFCYPSIILYPMLEGQLIQPCVQSRPKATLDQVAHGPSSWV